MAARAHFCALAALLALLLPPSSQQAWAAAAAAGKPAAPAGTTAAAENEAALTALQRDLGVIKSSVFTFWSCHGLDLAYGGFRGTLMRDGTPTTPAAKGLVQQARHAWAFSTWLQHNYTQAASVNNSRCEAAAANGSLPTTQQMAESAFEFVASHMARPDGLFNWNVSETGNETIQNDTVLYGQWFVLYSFSQYAQVFGSATAKNLAVACFRAMDAAWHNPQTGGYNEFKNNTFPKDLVLPPTTLIEHIASKVSAAVSFFTSLLTSLLHGGGDVLPRSLNVLMHGTEALTVLHMATKDPTALARLVELVEIICTRLARVNGLIYEEYVPSSSPNTLWQPAPRAVVNYGHNLESVWLVAETLDYLTAQGAISAAKAAQFREHVMSIGQAALRSGYDSQHGGVFESGDPVTGPKSTVKVWWIQAESMLAMWKLYKHTRDRTHLEQLVATTSFVRRFVNDNVHGGQFWQVEADGTYVVTGDIDKDTKGNRWKASYHDSRAVLYLEKWIKESRK